MKYGYYAQEIAKLNSLNARLDRLEAELRGIDLQLSNKAELSAFNIASLSRSREQLRVKIMSIYSDIPSVDPRVEDEDVDWATWTDRLRTPILTGGSFLCAFSGILGILGYVATYLPPTIMTLGAFAGVPVVGWVALGVALTVALGVAVWAYKVKYQPSLIECGKARREMHEKQVELFQRRTEYREYLVNSLKQDNFQKTIIFTPSKQQPTQSEVQDTKTVLPTTPATRPVARPASLIIKRNIYQELTLADKDDSKAASSSLRTVECKV